MIGGLGTKPFSIAFPKDLNLYVPAIAPRVQFSKNLSVGQTDPDVTLLQQTLNELGFSKQDPTGFYDSQTQQAVRGFQNEHGLETTGELDDATRNALNSLLQGQVSQPSQEQKDTGVDASRTKVFVEVRI